MKKVLSVLLSVMLFMMMFQGIQIFAAVDNSYAYVLSEQTPNYNDVTATVSEDAHTSVWLRQVTIPGLHWMD